MPATTQTHPVSTETATQPQPIKVGIMPLFSTWIYRCENGPTHLNDRLEELAHRLMQDDRNATHRTNFGGWHYAFDFFELQEEVVAEFRRVPAVAE